MGRAISWILIIICVIVAYQMGIFDWIVQYFENSANKMQQETVTQNEDGSTTTVKYKNVFNVIFDKE
jgi:hypothetical protein